MRTRTELQPFALGVIGSALALRASGDDERRLRRMRRLATIARRLPAGVFEMELLHPLRPATLNTTGRRSGRTHSVTLLLSPFGGGHVATTCMGRDPDWILNLRDDPRAVVVVGSSARPVVATFPRGARRAEAAAAFVDLRNPRVGALARRLVFDPTCPGPEMVMLSPC